MTRSARLLSVHAIAFVCALALGIGVGTTPRTVSAAPVSPCTSMVMIGEPIGSCFHSPLSFNFTAPTCSMASPRWHVSGGFDACGNNVFEATAVLYGAGGQIANKKMTRSANGDFSVTFACVSTEPINVSFFFTGQANYAWVNVCCDNCSG